MKARIEFNQNGHHYEDKRMLFALLGVVVINGKAENLVTVRCFVSKTSNNANYVSIYGNLPGYKKHFAGHSQAKGYGYHRPSAAMQGALTSAGVFLVDEERGHPVPIDGRGDAIMLEAVMAILRALAPEATDFQVYRA